MDSYDSCMADFKHAVWDVLKKHLKDNPRFDTSDYMGVLRRMSSDFFALPGSDEEE
jgi:hypothetical protein